MKCPLLRSKQIDYYGECGRTERERFLDCIQEECAWWNRTYKECSIKIVACWLTIIEDEFHKFTQRRTHTCEQL